MSANETTRVQPANPIRGLLAAPIAADPAGGQVDLATYRARNASTLSFVADLIDEAGGVGPLRDALRSLNAVYGQATAELERCADRRRGGDANAAAPEWAQAVAATAPERFKDLPAEVLRGGR